MIALATTGIAIIALLLVWREPPGGAATPEEAVAAYVDALNRNDADALRRLSPTPGPTLDTGIQRRLAEHGGRSIRIISQEILDGAVPHHAAARLLGEMTSPSGTRQTYQELLRMNRDEDRWYVSLHDLASTPAPGPHPLPTANIDPTPR